MSHCVNLEYVQHTATITISRPSQLNSLSEGAFLELRQVLRELHDNQDVRVVILKGDGKVFCAGGDIDFFAELVDLPSSERSEQARQYVSLAHEVMALFASLRVPLLVAVQGAAAGFGLSLCCVADIVVAARGSRFVPAYLGLGVTPDGGLSYSLPRLIGERRASDVLLTNRSFDAEQAENWGLVTRLVEANELEEDVSQVAQQLVSGPNLASANTLRLLHAQRNFDEFNATLAAELDSFSDCVYDDDFVEGVRAFLERRSPSYD
ncbi:MAG: enoyl-CoA hydratase/isomerase family protein [Gammaproteobacteria bacterium]|uniref:4-chlorobenzoyl coenzyme A dehalogenase-2 n=1 Tax=Marinobacter litoralis TaxID=187981 RepID=A0A3M2R8H3_9GAMM|nr:enoyl-CoA hydratase/isomerase family protein [Marinobacter litoralis]MBR9871686.1 enoyl-CoA hydratase/isomerase family protein [Gammaproteobacteria bacterium]RMJ01596.1 4-chlorobenzoyl coenzyme A dehalogenase-2 [Marinobacter litoralis]